MGTKYKQRVKSQLVEEANEWLEARAWLAEINRISVGRWYGGPFTKADFQEAKERGENVWAFLERMMAERHDPSCAHCGDYFCNGECLYIYFDHCDYCGSYGCLGECAEYYPDDEDWRD